MCYRRVFQSTHSFDVRKRVPPDPQDPNCVQYYSPGHLSKDNGGEHHYRISVTYVAFNAAGTELLVNMGSEHVYLFDLNNPRPNNLLKTPSWLPKKPKIEFEGHICSHKVRIFLLDNNVPPEIICREILQEKIFLNNILFEK